MRFGLEGVHYCVWPIPGITCTGRRRPACCAAAAALRASDARGRQHGRAAAALPRDATRDGSVGWGFACKGVHAAGNPALAAAVASAAAARRTRGRPPPKGTSAGDCRVRRATGGRAGSSAGSAAGAAAAKRAAQVMHPCHMKRCEAPAAVAYAVACIRMRHWCLGLLTVAQVMVITQRCTCLLVFAVLRTGLLAVLTCSGLAGPTPQRMIMTA